MEFKTPSQTPDMNQSGNARSHCQPGEFSELRRRILQKRNNEKAAAVLMGKLAKHSIIVRKGTTFLIVFSILALYAAVVLSHMSSPNRTLHSPVFKTAVR